RPTGSKFSSSGRARGSRPEGDASTMSYAGDVDPTEAWKMLSEDPAAALVDVRSQAEWSFVGVPDLSGIGKQPVLLQWQVYPAMTQNPDFVTDLTAVLPGKEDAILFLCRSGARSRAAA